MIISASPEFESRVDSSLVTSAGDVTLVSAAVTPAGDVRLVSAAVTSADDVGLVSAAVTTEAAAAAKAGAAAVEVDGALAAERGFARPRREQSKRRQLMTWLVSSSRRSVS